MKTIHFKPDIKLICASLVLLSFGYGCTEAPKKQQEKSLVDTVDLVRRRTDLVKVYRNLPLPNCLTDLRIVNLALVPDRILRVFELTVAVKNTGTTPTSPGFLALTVDYYVGSQRVPYLRYFTFPALLPGQEETPTGIAAFGDPIPNAWVGTPLRNLPLHKGEYPYQIPVECGKGNCSGTVELKLLGEYYLDLCGTQTHLLLSWDQSNLIKVNDLIY